MGDSTVKPLQFDRLFDWAMVTSAVPSHDRTRAMQCVLKPAPHIFSETNSLQRLTVRIYGFLGKHNLTTTGNWNRYVVHRPIRSFALYTAPTKCPKTTLFLIHAALCPTGSRLMYPLMLSFPELCAAHRRPSYILKSNLALIPSNMRNRGRSWRICEGWLIST